MPAKDLYHDAVVHALTTEGWTITHDPLRIGVGGQNLYIDLGAEREAIAAEKEGRQIAVEIKTFLGRSVVRTLEDALGQWRLYLNVLAELQPYRALYLAIPEHIYESLFAEKLGQIILKHEPLLRLIVFDEVQERIVKWIS